MAGPLRSLDAKDLSNTDLYLRFIVAYDVLHILGFIILVPVILTAWFSPRVQRTPTWFPLMISWALATINASLIFGRQIGPIPPFALCLTQAGFLYAIPILTGATAVAFLLQIYLGFMARFNHKEDDYFSRSPVFFAVPIGVAVALFVFVIVLGIQNPVFVTRDTTGMYCHISGSRVSKVSSGFLIAANLFMLILEVLIGILLYRNWVAFQHLQKLDNSLSLSTLVRVAIFSFLPLVVLILSLLVFKGRTGYERQITNIFIALVPLVAGIVFGSQKDILGVWLRRKSSGGSAAPSRQPLVAIHVAVISSRSGDTV